MVHTSSRKKITVIVTTTDDGLPIPGASTDAGELGSGHTVTALYEIVPAGVTSDYIKTIPELKYT